MHRLGSRVQTMGRHVVIPYRCSNAVRSCHADRELYDGTRLFGLTGWLRQTFLAPATWYTIITPSRLCARRLRHVSARDELCRPDFQGGKARGSPGSAEL